METWRRGQKAEVSCFLLEGKTLLQAALWDLHRLLSGWVTRHSSLNTTTFSRHLTSLLPGRMRLAASWYGSA